MNRWILGLALIVTIALVGFSSNWQVTNAQPSLALKSATTSNFGSALAICPAPIASIVMENPTTITDCTQAGIQAALDGGGEIAFACGVEPMTIGLTTPLRVTTQRTVLDGGGLVTLDGQNQTKILENPYIEGGNTLIIQNLRFVNGRAPASGGLASESGAAITSGSPGTRLHILNSTFANNQTTATTNEDNQGGAIFSNNSYETVIVGSRFENNQAGSGGAVAGLATGMILVNSHFSNNQAVDTTDGGIVRGYGGAFYLDGVTNDFNPDSNKTVQICGSIFENNQAIRGGGATATIISDNKGSALHIEQSTFVNNEVTGRDGQFGQGGAVYHVEDDHAGGRNEANLLISQSTFHANKALRQGGALWVYLLGTGQVVNSTFAGNTTTAPLNTVGQGGAMAVTLGRIGILNSTFANNHAAYQAGAIHGGGSSADQEVTLTNTIFLNNTLNEQDLPSETRWQGYHTNRPFVDGGGNMQHPRLKPAYNNDVNNNIVPNPIYVDPQLAALADNGGVNQTMALQAGSPAINQGVSACPATDQRGATRVDQCDIGAFEYGGITTAPTATPTATAGVTPSPTATAIPSTTPTATPTISPTAPGSGDPATIYLPVINR